MTEHQAKHLFEEVKALNYLFMEYIQIIDNFKFKRSEDNKSNFLSNELIFPFISYTKFNGLVLFCSNCINLYEYDLSVVQPNKSIMIKNSNITNSGINNDGVLIENLKLNNLKSPKNNTRNSSIINVSKSNVGNVKNTNYVTISNNNHGRLTNNAINKNKNGVNPFQTINVDQIRNIFSPINNKDQNNFNSKNPNKDFKTNYNDFVPGFNLNSEKNTNFHHENNINNDISNIENNLSFVSLNISNNINCDIDISGYSLDDFKDSFIFSKIKSSNLIKVIDDLNDAHNYNHINYNTNYNTELNNHNNIITYQNAKYKYMIISAIDLIPNLFNFENNHQFMFCPSSETKPFVFFDQYSTEKLNLKSEKAGILKTLKDVGEKILGLDSLNKSETFENNFCRFNLKIFYNNLNEENLNDLEQEKNTRLIDYFLNFQNKQIVVDESLYKILESIQGEKFSNLKNLINKNDLKIKGRSLIMFSLSSDIKLKYSLINSKLNDIEIKNLENKVGTEKNIYQTNLNTLYLKKFNSKNSNNAQNIPFEFIEKVDFLNYFENFTKYLDSLQNIDSIKTLKNFFHRFGINNSLEIFTLPKLRNSRIADLIKINILVKSIKSHLNYHQGLNFITKIFKINSKPDNDKNETNMFSNRTKFGEDYFEFIKEKNFYDIFRMKISYSILSILNPNLVNKIFLEHFNENLNFHFFLKNMKWRQLDNSIGFFLFDDNSININNKEKTEKFSNENFLQHLVETAQNKPFIFLQAFEYHMKISIDPIIKFKASLSKYNFTNYFSEIHINDTEPLAVSYIKTKEISFYLLSKCIHTAHTSSNYDFYKDRLKLKTNKSDSNKNFSKDTKPSSGLTEKNTFNTKINSKNQNNQAIIGTVEFNNKIKNDKNINENNYYNDELNKDFIMDQDEPILNEIYLNNKNNDHLNNINSSKRNIPLANQNMLKINNNIKINSNNITNINIRNTKFNNNLSKNQFINEINNSKCNTFIEKTELFNDKFEDKEHFNRTILIWENLSRELDLNFPSVLYKMSYKKGKESDLKSKNNLSLYKSNYNINKFLKSHYSFNKIEIIKDWKNSSEILLNDIITNDNSESCIIYSMFIILVHYIYVEFDYNLAKEILNKIKDNLKNYYHFRFEDLACVNLLEAAIVEKKNYVDSEEFITKSLIFSMFLYGDPRGRNTPGNNFMLFPFWKISRQTLILENSIINENFKEMFHCQDYVFKNKIENSFLKNNLNIMYDNRIQYHLENIIKKRYINNINSQNHYKNNDHEENYLYNNINISDIIIDEHKTSELDENQNFHISDNNFSYSTKYKYFPFPSISDVKNSYQNYFNSENFINFLFKSMIFLNESEILYDEEILNKIGLNNFSVMSSLDLMVSNKHSTTTINSDAGSRKSRHKANVLSPYLYDFLNEKMCFKRNLPYGVVLTWGNNSHNETSHNVKYIFFILEL